MQEYSIINNTLWDHIQVPHVYMIPVCLVNTTFYVVEAFEAILNGMIDHESAPKNPQ